MAPRSVTKKRTRAPRWKDQQTLDLIEVWSDPSIRSGLRSRKADTERKIACCMKKKGHNRNAEQCSKKMSDLKYFYRKAEKANAQPGASPQRCPYYDQLHPILRGSTPRAPNRRVGNSLALGREEQHVGNNQAATSSFRDSTDPGEGPSAGPAGRLRRSSPRLAALQPSQIRKRKRVEKQQEGIVERLERIEEQQVGIVERLERIDEQQEGIVERLERIDEQQEGIVERLERIDEQQEGIVERLERIEEQQERIVERLERNVS